MVHGFPRDYTRWTADGLQGFLEDCGFDANVKAWGNRKVVITNFTRWENLGWHRDLSNDPDFPIVVWAYAKKAHR